jgi:hypothetical protein
MKQARPQFVVCVSNEGCEDLELRRLYRVLRGEEPEEPGYLRIVDESGEDYLYPAKYFVPVEIGEEAADLLLAV